MNAIESLIEQIPDYARDIRLNLGVILTEEGAPGLSPSQIFGIALACAYATRSRSVVEAISTVASEKLTSEETEAAKAAASIMAMNNVYYRFLHLTEDPTFSQLPARLRMNVIGKPGIPKVDFELYSLAVSALSGCGKCINAHIHEVRKANISNEGIQSAIRIASVINSVGQTRFIQAD